MSSNSQGLDIHVAVEICGIGAAIVNQLSSSGLRIRSIPMGKVFDSHDGELILR